MAVYPLRIPRHPYRGRDPAKLRKAGRFNATAEKLERHINSEFGKSNDQSRIFFYGGIAIELGLDKAEVTDVLFGVEAGGNGITMIRKPADDLS